jgi:hypothetical protein
MLIITYTIVGAHGYHGHPHAAGYVDTHNFRSREGAHMSLACWAARPLPSESHWIVPGTYED